MTERLNTERDRSPKPEPLHLDRHDAAYVSEVKLAHLLRGIRAEAEQKGRPQDDVAKDERVIGAARDILGQVGWGEIEGNPRLSVALGSYREEMGVTLAMALQKLILLPKVLP